MVPVGRRRMYVNREAAISTADIFSPLSIMRILRSQPWEWTTRGSARPGRHNGIRPCFFKKVGRTITSYPGTSSTVFASGEALGLCVLEWFTQSLLYFHHGLLGAKPPNNSPVFANRSKINPHRILSGGFRIPEYFSLTVNSFSI